MTNEQVIQAWLQGEEAQSNNLKTSGCELFSYDLLIARYRWSDNTPIVYNYRSKNGGRFISRTTSKHVTMAELAALRLLNRQPLLEPPHDH